jgi:hypothetical protein
MSAARSRQSHEYWVWWRWIKPLDNMTIAEKLAKAKHMIATRGARATLRFARSLVIGRFRHAILGEPLTWMKFDLINELARIHGYRSILEISTAHSGHTYNKRDRTRFDVCRRLSYLTPDDWTDGEPVDYRCSDHDTSDCVRQIRAEGLRFDIVFVDACHEYECSSRDIQDALDLVNDNGVVVLHDCLPDSQANCPPFRGDLVWRWLGVTYKAYLDVLIARNDLWYCTVETDEGCGVIRSSQESRQYKRAINGDEACFSAWRNVGDNYDAAFQIYEESRNSLMNVVTVNKFLIAERKAKQLDSASR